jgi:hypothetical protein
LAALQDVSIDGQLCGTIGMEATVNTISCGDKLGRIVKVALKGSNYLTLCEVEVWGSPGPPSVPLSPSADIVLSRVSFMVSCAPAFLCSIRWCPSLHPSLLLSLPAVTSYPSLSSSRSPPPPAPLLLPPLSSPPHPSLSSPHGGSSRTLDAFVCRNAYASDLSAYATCSDLSWYGQPPVGPGGNVGVSENGATAHTRAHTYMGAHARAHT